MSRFLALALIGFLATTATAQTVRFKTNVGSFDMVLNPTGNPALQGNVDNLLQYVTSGRYDNTVINRAATYLDVQQQEVQFVLQMGALKTAGAAVPATVDGFVPIETFAPVTGAPGIAGLSNTRGMVGLALAGDGQGGIDHDSGTSSFYINLANNDFLDPDFTVLAQIPNMATIDAIMALQRVNLLDNPNFGAGAGNLYFTDVPLAPNGNLVLITRAFEVPEPAVGTLAGLAVATLIAWRWSTKTFASRRTAV